MRRRFSGALPWLGLAALAWLAGCRSDGPKPDAPTQPPPLTPTAFDYVDSDAFDGLFESALVNQDPAVLVRTGRQTADWGPRLNAWIAAWNAGGPARARSARGQSPGVPLDGESVREFRLLVEGLLGRIDEAASAGSAWYRDRRERSRRVALLAPYSLRFHKGEAAAIELVFFHGRHASRYGEFVRELTGSDASGAEWARALECSECDPRRKGVLTGRAP